MEKKLTDEEIMKALDFCYSSPCCGCGCPYFNKHGRNFCVEDKALYKDLKRIVLEHADQKAEIERLTELQSRGSYRVAELSIENAELQKQVEELKVYLASEKVCSKQAVKDTAKEISKKVVDLNVIYGDDFRLFLDNFELWVKERYGVSYEENN